ncbi:MAG: hypothetical protein JW787_05540 [Sedimentisphaerales bacterium]|nr:hypothetical protein [Sedimentisphaerales bacterium]
MIVSEDTRTQVQDTNKQIMPEYTPIQEVIDNIPYAVMTLLGMVIFITAFSESSWGIIAGFAYLLYGIAGAVWIMIFVCPYCRYWDTRSCPCGYGRIASRFRKKSRVECFSDKFKRHIPVIVPLWFIPLLAGLPAVVGRFSWLLLILLIIFAIDAFVILPLVSTKHGCKECPQKDSCPWMKHKIKPAAQNA